MRLKYLTKRLKACRIIENIERKAGKSMVATRKTMRMLTTRAETCGAFAVEK